MKSRIILIFALFLTLNSFGAKEKAVKQSNVKTLRSMYVALQPPVITIKLQDLVVNEGQSAEFRIRFSSGDANTRITWYKDGKEINNVNEYFDISVEGDTAVLRLKRASGIHQGRYTVRVTNSAGETTSSAVLKVR